MAECLYGGEDEAVDRWEDVKRLKTAKLKWETTESRSEAIGYSPTESET